MMKKLSMVLVLSGLACFAQSAPKPPTVAEARAFLDKAEVQLLALNTESGRADWVKSTFITDDTETLAAAANQRAIEVSVKLAKQATRFDSLKLPADMARKMKLLKLALTVAAPADVKESAEVTRILASLEGAYGKGKYCPAGQEKCLDLEDITRIMANSRDPAQLLEVWKGWHAVAPPMRANYRRFPGAVRWKSAALMRIAPAETWRFMAMREA